MNKFALACATVFSITLASGLSPDNIAPKAQAAAPGPISHTFNWTIEIDTQEMPRQFQYRGSTLKQVVKTQLQFYSQNNQNAKTAYEDIWYSNGRSLGMERHGSLAIKQGDAIAITVVHTVKTNVPLDEQQAAGKAAMKAFVDANLNQNMVATIKVPAASFQTISSVLQGYNFTPVTYNAGDPETAVNSDMNIFLEAYDPVGQVQTLAHLH